MTIQERIRQLENELIFEEEASTRQAIKISIMNLKEKLSNE